MLCVNILLGLLLSIVHAKHLTTRQGISTSANCPNDDTEQYTDRDNSTYRLACGHSGQESLVDIVGTYLDTSEGLAACIRYCSDYNLGNPQLHCDDVVADANVPEDDLLLCRLKNGVIDPVQDTNYDTAYIISQPDPLPAITYTFQPICPQDDRKFYLDDQGVTFQIMCNSDLSTHSNEVAATSVGTYGECADLCSKFSHPQEGCSGFEFDGSNCNLMQGYAVSTGGGRMAGVAVRKPSQCTVSNTTTNFTLDEGGTYFQSSIYQIDFQLVLSNSTQSTACLCVEQCAFYNRQVNGTDQTRCIGIQYDTDPGLQPNCYVTSQ